MTSGTHGRDPSRTRKRPARAAGRANGSPEARPPKATASAAQRTIDWAGLAESRAERRAQLLAAWRKRKGAIPSLHLECKTLLLLVFDMGREEGLKKSFSDLAEAYLEDPTANRSRTKRAVAYLLEAGLLERERTEFASGSNSANVYRIDWRGVSETLAPDVARAEPLGEGDRKRGWSTSDQACTATDQARRATGQACSVGDLANRTSSPSSSETSFSPLPGVEPGEGEGFADEEADSAGAIETRTSDEAREAAILAVARAGVGTARRAVEEAVQAGYEPERIERLAELFAIEQAKSPPTFESGGALKLRLTQPVELDDREGWVCGRLPEPVRTRPPREDPERFRTRLWRRLRDQGLALDEIEARVDAALREKFPELFLEPSC